MPGKGEAWLEGAAVWGWPVRWCRAFDRTGDFCRFCVLVNRAFHLLVLHRNPTFIGFQPGQSEPEDTGNPGDEDLSQT